ncbi:MAG: hypothetical protein ACKVPX_00515 [Myxococcaceae bacterium]
MTSDDEVAFLRQLERHELTLYPIRVPPNWRAPKVNAQAFPHLPDEAAYFAAEGIAPILVDRVKRGPDKGSLRIDEVRSPVIYFERSRLNEEGELTSGKFWAELDVTPQKGRRDPAPDRFRRLFLDVVDFLHKAFRRGDPKAFWIGPAAARAAKEGLVLRDAEHRGGVVTVHR